MKKNFFLVFEKKEFFWDVILVKKKWRKSLKGKKKFFFSVWTERTVAVYLYVVKWQLLLDCYILSINKNKYINKKWNFK